MDQSIVIEDTDEQYMDNHSQEHERRGGDEEDGEEKVKGKKTD